MKLNIENMDFAYKPGHKVLTDISLEARPGEITALIGPNAAGKSTLIKCIAGLLNSRGTVKLDSRETSTIPKEELNRLIGYLPQEISTRAVLTVFEAILIGRLKTLSWRVSNDDLEKALDIITVLDIEELAPRFLNELSGGQKQMVSIAQTLVAEPKILLLDEPISNLDLRHEMEILDVVKNVTRSHNTTTVLAIHNLSLAARYADRLVVLKEGRVHSNGTLQAVLTPETVREVYGVEAKILKDDGIFQIVPVGPLDATVKRLA